VNAERSVVQRETMQKSLLLSREVLTILGC
jgi:hypothetical protein